MDTMDTISPSASATVRQHLQPVQAKLDAVLDSLNHVAVDLADVKARQITRDELQDALEKRVTIEVFQLTIAGLEGRIASLEKVREQRPTQTRDWILFSFTGINMLIVLSNYFHL